MNANTENLNKQINDIIIKLTTIREKISTKKEKYPNLCKAWETAIQFKVMKLLNMLNDCENFCEKIEDTLDNDLPASAIALLYILNNNYLNKSQ